MGFELKLYCDDCGSVMDKEDLLTNTPELVKEAAFDMISEIEEDEDYPGSIYCKDCKRPSEEEVNKAQEHARLDYIYKQTGK